MKATALFIFLLVVTGLASCDRGFVSKVPNIGYTASTDILAQLDTMRIYFKVSDGDADIGNSPAVTGPSAIFWKYTRDSANAPFHREEFPFLDRTVEDPKKGLEADCTLMILPGPELRADHPDGDTVIYEIYVTDRAGNKSNIMTTNPVYVRP